MTPRDVGDIHEAARLHQAGELSEAEAIYRTILGSRPDEVDANHFLGLALHQMGRSDEAWGYIERSISLRPADPRNLFNAADVLAALGRWEKALGYYQRVIALQPNHAATWHRLGIACKWLGKDDEAIAAYRKAIAIKPDFVEALTDLGSRLQDRGAFADAIELYRQALKIRPDFVNAINNLGMTLRSSGDPAAAVQQFEKALALQPNEPKIRVNLVRALCDSGDLDQSIAVGKEVVAGHPDWEEARFTVGLSYLQRGDYLAAWAHCRWEDRANQKPYAHIPKWDGSDLTGRTILLHAEDGFGDAIEFVRYAPMVAARGGRVLLKCHPALHRLLSCISSIEKISSNDEPMPACDVHCSLMGLPRVFGTTLESVPMNVPYLSADPAIAETWKHRLAREPAALKVGLAWAGSPSFTDDRLRSPHLAAMAGLGGARGVRFYSIQKGYAAAEAKTPPAGIDLVDWTNDLNDFADTAALIANLDLVISSDTAVVHVAGAMGKPIWVLLPFTPGCFWLSKRPDSPWYPTMRLFRQLHSKSWAEPVDAVVAALAQFVNSSAG